MKAARFYDRNDIRIEDIPAPKVAPGEVLVKVAWCGICGTDLHEYLDGPIFCPQHGTRTPSRVRILPSPWATSSPAS